MRGTIEIPSVEKTPGMTSLEGISLRHGSQSIIDGVYFTGNDFELFEQSRVSCR